MIPVEHSTTHWYVLGLWRWRAAVLAALATAIVVLGTGMLRLGLANTYEIYFDDSNPQLEALQSLHETFSRNDNVLFAVAPSKGDVFTPEILSLLGELTTLTWKLPYASRVSSITNYQHVESSEDEVWIHDLVETPDSVTPEKARDIRSIALAQSQLVGRILSTDGSVAGVNVRLELDPADRQGLAKAVREARLLAARFESSYPDVRIYLTGNAMLNAAFPEASVNDLTHLTPLMYFLITFGIWIFLRSLRAALIVMLSVVLASVVAMGCAGWLGLAVSSASVVAPTIITTVVVAYSLHVLTGFLRLRAEQLSSTESIAQTLTENIRPIAVAALTTIVGFLSLNFSEAPPFRDLGNITSIGVVAAFVLSVVLLPLLLLMLSPGGRRPPLVRLGGFANWVIRFRTQCVLGVLLSATAAIFVIPQLELNDSFVEYFDERVEFRRDTDFVMSHLTGIYQVEYAMHSGASDGVYDPVYVRALDRFERWLSDQPEVIHVFSIAEILKRLHVHLGADSNEFPANREQMAQYMLLYEISVPFGLDLNDRIDVDRESSRVSVTLRNLDNAALHTFERRADEWLLANVPLVMRAPAVGAAIMFAYIAERNIHAMISGALLAVLLIAVLLAVLFRGFRMGLLSLLPNAVPALIAIAVWTLAVGEMGVALAIVMTMTLGIVVDDTVHFVTCFLHGRRKLGLSPDAAVRHAFFTTGSALVSTSVVLALGFCVLSLSAFEVNHSMGQLTALVIVCALVADFLMLPGLLIAAARRGWV